MKIGNRYEVIEELGQGGVGRVYRCTDLSLKKDVAVKMLRIDSDKAIPRFHRECVVLAKLKHKNILEVLDFGQANDEVYLVTSFIPGKTLKQFVKEKKEIRLEDVIDFFIEVCDGLEYAHSHGVIHRDIKPSNIMILDDVKNGSVKILDFGTAKDFTLEQHLTQTGVGLGTPCYISPEQAINADVDARSDIYSMGCMMFEALALRPPFQKESAVETILMHRQMPAPLLSDVAGDRHGERIESIINKCLEKEKNDRYESVAALRDELLKLRVQPSNSYVEAAAPAKQYAVRTRRRSEPLLIYISVFLFMMLVAAAGATYIVVNDRHEDDELIRLSKKDRLPPDHMREMTTTKTFSLAADRRFAPDTFRRYDDGVLVYQFHGQISDGDLASVSKQNPEMQHLKLHGDQYGGEGFVVFANTQLKSIELDNCFLSDGIFACFAKLHLNRLELDECTNLSGNGVEKLAQIKELRYLRLSGCTAHENIWSKIAQIKRLEAVSLSRSKFVTGALVKQLRPLKNLRSLDLGGSAFGAANLKELAALPSLRVLDLSDLHLKDDDMNALLKLPLEELRLSKDNISDAGLQNVARIRSLKRLVIYDCDQVTTDGINAFQRARPACRIAFGPPQPKAKESATSRTMREFGIREF